MSVFFNEFVVPTFLSLGQMLLKIVLIIIVIMITIEVLKAFKVLEWINKRLYFFTRFLGISSQAAFPLLIGLTIGITYGAGAILLSYKNQEMSKKDVLLVSIFLCLCHAIFEDTLLFSSMGASGWVMVTLKLLLATIVTFFASRIINRKEQKAITN